MRCGHSLGDRTDRPVRGHPFARGMRKDGGEADQPSLRIDCGRLDRGELVLAKALADNVDPLASEAYLKERLFLAGKGNWMVAVKDFSGFLEFALSLGQARSRSPRWSHWSGAWSCLRVQKVEAHRARL